MTRLNAAGRLALVVGIALLIPILPFVMVGELPGERWLSHADENAFAFGLLGAGLLTSDVLLPIPSSIIGTLLGARLGFLSGLTWTWLGLSLGHLIAYGMGRLLLSRLTTKLPVAPTLLAVFVSRPVPVLAEAAAFTAGAARVSAGSFLLSAAAGNLIYALVLAGNGATLVPQALLGPGLLVPMTLPVLAWLLWRRLRTSGGPQTER
jgi:membrane protein DedA with SNARE-associated domain